MKLWKLVSAVSIVLATTLGSVSQTASADTFGDIRYDEYGCEQIYTIRGWEYFSILGEAYCYKQLYWADSAGNPMYDEYGNLLWSYQYDGYLKRNLEAANWDFSAVSPAFRRNYYDDINGGRQFHTIILYENLGGLWWMAFAYDAPFAERWRVQINGIWDFPQNHLARACSQVVGGCTTAGGIYVPTAGQNTVATINVLVTSRFHDQVLANMHVHND